MYKYKYGLYIGRFQPIHIGHESIIRKMLNECERAVIAIGSAQECGTMKNPFTAEQRADLISNVFYRERITSQLKIMYLPDRDNPSNDPSWGDYVFRNFYSCFYTFPDVIYEGEEAERKTWYDNRNVEIVRVYRGDIPVSATLVRKTLESTLPCYEAFNLLPKEIHYRIPEMREAVRNANKN